MSTTPLEPAVGAATPPAETTPRKAVEAAIAAQPSSERVHRLVRSGTPGVRLGRDATSADAGRVLALRAGPRSPAVEIIARLSSEKARLRDDLERAKHEATRLERELEGARTSLSIPVIDPSVVGELERLRYSLAAAERARADAESSRAAAERVRSEAEAARDAADVARTAAEAALATVEALRAEAESARARSEERAELAAAEVREARAAFERARRFHDDHAAEAGAEIDALRREVESLRAEKVVVAGLRARIAELESSFAKDEPRPTGKVVKIVAFGFGGAVAAAPSTRSAPTPPSDEPRAKRYPPLASRAHRLERCLRRLDRRLDRMTARSLDQELIARLETALARAASAPRHESVVSAARPRPAPRVSAEPRPLGPPGQGGAVLALLGKQNLALRQGGSAPTKTTNERGGNS